MSDNMGVQIETGIDRLMFLVDRNKELSIGEASSQLDVSRRIIEDWVDSLEEAGLIMTRYALRDRYLICPKHDSFKNGAIAYCSELKKSGGANVTAIERQMLLKEKEMKEQISAYEQKLREFSKVSLVSSELEAKHERLEKKQRTIRETEAALKQKMDSIVEKENLVLKKEAELKIINKELEQERRFIVKNKTRVMKDITDIEAIKKSVRASQRELNRKIGSQDKLILQYRNICTQLRAERVEIKRNVARVARVNKRVEKHLNKYENEQTKITKTASSIFSVFK